MTNDPTRRGSVFGALVLILFGILFLLHAYRGFPLGQVFSRWWPLLLILLGVIKLMERAGSSSQPGARPGYIRGREVLLILALVALVGIVVGTEHLSGQLPRGNVHSFDLASVSRSAPLDAHVTLRNGRGSIHVRPGSAGQPSIIVSGRKNVTTWTEREASQMAERASIEIAQEGTAYEIRPAGPDTRENRIGFDLEVEVPPNTSLTIRSTKGDIDVSDLGGPLSISAHGDVDVRNIRGDVSVEFTGGDTKVSGVEGDVRVSGSGSEVEVLDVTGSATIQGEYYSPIHAEHIAKGIRFVSRRTDLTLTQPFGRFEIRPGSFEIADSAGNLTISTRENDLSFENITGRVRVDTRNGDVHFRLAAPPKEEIEITNSSASIAVTFPSSAAFQISADCHSCDIDSEFQGLRKTTTSSGDSHLEGSVGSRGPRITLKTSYGAISIHKGT